MPRVPEPGPSLDEGALGSQAAAVLVADAVSPGRPLVSVSPAFERVTGFAAHDVVGRDCSFLYGPETDETAIAELRRAEQELRGATVTYRCYRRNGTSFWAEETMAPIRSPAGDVTHFVGVLTDVTRQRETELALRESETRFRGAFEAAPIGMALTDGEGRFLRVNRALCEMLGYEEDELLRRTLQSISHPDELPANLDLLARANAGEVETYELEKRYAHRLGHDVWANLSTSIVRDSEGRVAYMVSQVLDVTSRKRTQETLRQRDAMLQAVATVAEQLLRTDRWQAVIDDVLRELGEAVGVSRAYLFRAHDDAAGTEVISQLHEWAAPGIEPQIGNPELQEHRPAGAEREWMTRLRAGRLVQSHLRDADSATRSLLERHQIVSLILVPVRVNGSWWGFLGFDECARERGWTAAESESLRAAAGAIAAAIQRRGDEDARREAEARYRTLVEQLPLTTYIDRLDPDMTPVYVSPQIESVLGYPVDEWLADSSLFGRILHPDDRERVIAGDQPDDDGPHRSEYRLRARNGREVWFLDEYRIVHDDLGRRLYAQGYMLDITERKRIEEDLRQANELLRAVVQASPLGIIVTDLDNRVTLWNVAAERIYGYTGAEVMNVYPPTRPPDRHHEYEYFLDACRRGEWIAGFETQRIRKDGTAIEVSISLAPLTDAAGRLVGILGVHEDITERRALESRLLRSQRLEAVGRLAGGVAHDFNNLLTAISGYGEFLADALDAHDPLQRDVEEVRRAADRAAALVRQLLAFSRRQMMRPQVVDLGAVVADTETLLRRLIGEDVTLVAALDPSLAPIRADPAQLEQIVVNLAVNARDAMPSGGTLSIRTENLPEEGAIRLTVSDTGLGMDAETLEHVFEPFFTTKELGKGTGLGLSTVYGIVAQNGGSIEVTSEPGRGTAVTITLPALATRGEHPSQDVTASSEGAASGTLLLVEDDAFVRELAERVLRGNGYTVLAAASGDRALERARAHVGTIDLLLTDVVMPEMSGPELATRLQAERPALRVLYTSGYADDVAFASHAKPAAFLGKPFTPESLRHKVREVLEGATAG